MAATFPSIKPARRRYKLGSYPVKTYRALNGATVKRAFGNKPFGYTLELEFINLANSETKQILDHYISTKSGFERFAIPVELFADMTTGLTGLIQAPSGILWEYANAPDVQFVYKGRDTVAVSLIGELTA